VSGQINSISISLFFRRVTSHGSLVTIACLLFAACTEHQARGHHHAEFIAMGTTMSIDVVGVEEEKAREVIGLVRSEIEFLGREWYPWATNGELVRLNRAIEQGEQASVSPVLARLLLRAQELHRASDGNFDPAVGRLVEMWGFHQADRDPARPWPTDAQLRDWQTTHPTFADLSINGLTVTSKRGDLLLDLGAIGKGHAVDLGIEILKKHGVSNALVNAGGNLRAIGQAKLAQGNGTEPQRPWRVAIRDPRENGAMAWLELQRDESLSTSGDYERFAMRGAERANHVLEPKTGRSASHTMAVTVIATDATLADAASTAIFVAGPDVWRTVARTMGVPQTMRIDASGKVEITRALASRLRPPGNESPPLEWQTVDL
jgi:thiamine biosynthesis lipoprotein